MKPLAFIGIDPGTTCAYVILDLNGVIIKKDSAKELPLSEVISQIMSVCKPMIVGTDKAKVPSFVEEFSRKVGAGVISPNEDMKKEEKSGLLQQYGRKVKNTHEQDALAAALLCYKKYLPKLKKINLFIEEHNFDSRREEFTKIALKEDLNFLLIKELLTKKTTENKIFKQVVREDKITRKDYLTLFEKLSNIKKERTALENKNKKLKQKLKELRKANTLLEKKSSYVGKKIDTLFSFKEERLKLQDKQIKEKEIIIDGQSEEIKRLQAFITRVPHLQLVKKLENLGQEEFHEKSEILNIKENDFLFVLNPSIFSEKTVDELFGKGITVVSEVTISKTIKNKFQTVHLSEKFAHENDFFGLIEKGVLEKELNKGNLVENIVKEYKERNYLS